jgi:hypothetical protein
MKIIQFLLCICFFAFAFSSCQKKSKSNVNTGFKDEAGTGANPFKNQKNVSLRFNIAAQTPIYLALLPENYNGPKGEFWSNQKIINWQDLNYKKEDDFQ